MCKNQTNMQERRQNLTNQSQINVQVSDFLWFGLISFWKAIVPETVSLERIASMLCSFLEAHTTFMDIMKIGQTLANMHS